jgi:predicted DNA-binding transcriptional regulator YafY
MKALDRILGILLILQSQRRIPARRLAERFAVSTRTIYRDLQTMSLLGIPVYAERGRNGGVRLLEGYFLPPLMFTRSEAVALLLGIIMLRTLRAVPFQADAETALQKLLAAVPEHLRVTLARLGQIVGAELPPADIFHAEPDEPPTEGNSERDSERDGATVTQFLQALLDGAAIRLEYQSPYRDASMTVEARPLGLFWDRGRWYLATDDGERREKREERRLWRADRVMDIRALAQQGANPVAFDINTLLGHAWLREAMQGWRERAPVRLRITPEQAQRLQRDWYYRFAQYEAGDDSTIIMTLGEQDIELPLALARWLGPGAELLSPAPWRALLRAQLERMLRQLDATDATS